MSSKMTLGFVGLGVMGEPICANLATKSGHPVIACDTDPARALRLADRGVVAAESADAVFEAADIVFLSLPSGEIVEKVLVASGIIDRLRAGQTIVDLGTSSVEVTRRIAALCAARGVEYADAPVARTRTAAIAGTLAVMVGGGEALFERLLPLIGTFATDITHCGDVGAGQVVKILNNTILFQIGVALSEARTVGERAGVSTDRLFEALSKGSADSFALRNHGMKAMAPGVFPDNAFSVKYARKDLSYGLQLAASQGVDVPSARHVDTVFQAAIAAGFGDFYWPVICRLSDSAQA